MCDYVIILHMSGIIVNSVVMVVNLILHCRIHECLCLQICKV